MKKAIFRQVLFLLFPLMVHAQWVQVNPNTTAFLRSICFRNESEGFIVGDNGSLLKTSDGGVTWNQVPSGISTNLYSVAFPTPDAGYIAGEGGVILKTTNGGDTWSLLPDPVTGSHSFQSVCFLDEDKGFIAGYIVSGGWQHGLILRTSDGGQTWISTMLPEIQTGLDYVFFADPLTGFAAGQYGVIARTTDGGISWTTLMEGTGYFLFSIYFTSPDTGFVVGETKLKTTNGGATWTTFNPGFSLQAYSVFFTSANVGYLAGRDGIIKKTANGGSTWSTSESGTTEMLWNVYFPNPDTGFVIGTNGTILRTTDGGTTSLTEKEVPSPVFTLSPNPASEKTTIYKQIEIPEETSISVFDLQGKRQMVERSFFSKTFQLDLSSLGKGMYFIELQTSRSKEVIKVVKL